MRVGPRRLPLIALGALAALIALIRRLALHGEVHVFALSQEDRAGAGTEDGSFTAKLNEWLDHAFSVQQLEHGGAFAAGHDQAVAGVQLLSRADFDSAASGPLHGFAVSVEIALQGEYTDRLHTPYQPRVWRSSLSGSLETSKPRIASPSSSLASRSLTGSL